MDNLPLIKSSTQKFVNKVYCTKCTSCGKQTRIIKEGFMMKRSKYLKIWNK